MKFAQAMFAAGCAMLVSSGMAVPTDELTNEEKVRLFANNAPLAVTGSRLRPALLRPLAWRRLLQSRGRPRAPAPPLAVAAAPAPARRSRRPVAQPRAYCAPNGPESPL